MREDEERGSIKKNDSISNWFNGGCVVALRKKVYLLPFAIELLESKYSNRMYNNQSIFFRRVCGTC